MWRNWIARGTSNPKVAGSNPVTDSLIFFSLLYLPLEHGGLVQWKNTQLIAGEMSVQIRQPLRKGGKV